MRRSWYLLIQRLDLGIHICWLDHDTLEHKVLVWLNPSKGFVKSSPATKIELGCPFALRVAVMVGSCHQCPMHCASTSPLSFAAADELTDMHWRCLGSTDWNVCCWTSMSSMELGFKLADMSLSRVDSNASDILINWPILTPPVKFSDRAKGSSI
ncbi:hypothetical protein L484_011963 [Morus notabilis]|uniref:Uncharacterized protein n=1 Tax=Morus notabilis TaxID=981085 RepID=W9SCW2_9ROSA|nr:hypothetical protein L484_011963 [Morus notabilis]